MKNALNYILTIGALCVALADMKGDVIPPALHGYLALGAVIAAVLAKSPLFNTNSSDK